MWGCIEGLGFLNPFFFFGREVHQCVSSPISSLCAKAKMSVSVTITLTKPRHHFNGPRVRIRYVANGELIQG